MTGSAGTGIGKMSLLEGDLKIGTDKMIFSFNAWASEDSDFPLFLGGMDGDKGKDIVPERR